MKDPKTKIDSDPKPSVSSVTKAVSPHAAATGSALPNIKPEPPKPVVQGRDESAKED